jgi:hypothetical protein
LCALFSNCRRPIASNIWVAVTIFFHSPFEKNRLNRIIKNSFSGSFINGLFKYILGTSDYMASNNQRKMKWKGCGKNYGDTILISIPAFYRGAAKNHEDTQSRPAEIRTGSLPNTN